jgi:K+-transporting ATPase ATPase A chain
MFSLALGCIGLGGVGTGLTGFLIYTILTLFLCGLLIGRTPEYLNKKIQKKEVQLIILILLISTFCNLILPAFCLFQSDQLHITNPNPHKLTLLLYTFFSATANNGSLFSGASYDTPFFNTLLGITFFLGRFSPLILTIALAGCFSQKQSTLEEKNRFPLHGPLFCSMLFLLLILFVALSFLPAFCIGPIAELFHVHL